MVTEISLFSQKALQVFPQIRHHEIAAFVHGATTGDWPAYQVSALLMAIVLRGMTPDETA